MAEKISIQIALAGGAEIERQLADIGKAGEKAFVDISKAAEQAGGFKNLKPEELEAKLKNLGVTGVDALNKIRNAVQSAGRLEGLVQGVQAVENGFAAVGRAALGLPGVLAPIALAAGFVGKAIVTSMTEAAEAISKIDQAAIKAGTSIGKFDQLRLALERTGLSAKSVQAAMEGVATATQKAELDGVTQAFDKLAASGKVFFETVRGQRFPTPEFLLLRDAAEGVGPAADKARAALVQLGQPVPTPLPTLSDFITKLGDASRGTAAFVESLRQMPDSANRSALAINAFGAAGAELVQMLRLGLITNDQFVERLGALTQAQANNSNALEASLNRGRAAMERFKLTGDFSQLIVFWNEFKTTASIVMSQIGEQLGALGPSIVAGWNAIAGAIGSAATAVGNFVSTMAGIAWDTLRSLGVGAWNAITGAITGAVNAVMKFLGLKWPSGGAGGGANAPGGIPMARGGLLGGRGTGTSDSNLAWLSRGEYVTPARVVRQPGVLAFLEALRRSGRIPGFAAGGRVENTGLADRLEKAGVPMSTNIEDRREQSLRYVVTRVITAVAPPIQNEIEEVIDRLRTKVVKFHNNTADAIIATLEAHIDRMMVVVGALGTAMVGIMKSIEDATSDARGGTIAALGALRISLEGIAKSLRDSDGFASGGLLGGRGSGTSDSNLAWVSRGEYVTPARAVAQPGVLAFLEALRRSGGNLRHVLDGMGRFALGGMVRGPIGIPAFAGGGMANVTIQFPGLPEISGLRASSGAVDELRKAAALAQVRSGGRKPSRYS